jgi:hypothetical protein
VKFVDPLRTIGGIYDGSLICRCRGMGFAVLDRRKNVKLGKISWY